MINRPGARAAPAAREADPSDGRSASSFASRGEAVGEVRAIYPAATRAAFRAALAAFFAAVLAFFAATTARFTAFLDAPAAPLLVRGLLIAAVALRAATVARSAD